MLDIGNNDGPRPKCYFTRSLLPAFVDHDQPSQKKIPFSTIKSSAFTHTLELVLQKSALEDFQSKLKGDGTVQYAKVYMKLSDVIEGDFFNQYIKSGNIMMLSEGRPYTDNAFSLDQGILRLEVDKPTYERMGLKGTAIPHAGRKHVKARYVIELNLRLPSMVRGKHGFERIVWAFKNILDQRVAWLFYDCTGPNDGSGPIAAHQPQLKRAKAEIAELGAIVVPSMPDDMEIGDEAAEVLEWLSLVGCQSPRVREDDNIDPYLSRYEVPTLVDDREESTSAEDLVKISWRGLLPSTFVQRIFIAALRSSKDTWFAVNMQAFGGTTKTFLQKDQHTLTWEYED